MCHVNLDLTMSRHQKRTPSLEDALAKGFSELKVGEDNLESAPVSPPPVSDNEEGPKQQPIAYNQKFEAVEDREEFVVATPIRAQAEIESEPTLPTPTTITEHASTSIGDDFEVEW
jgi:FtsZ-interacting cell division protein ZipA